MAKKINYEEIAFGMISKIGEAKSITVETYNQALTDRNYAVAYKKISAAEKLLNEAGKLHMDVIAEEANGVQLPFSVLFMHAEDQYLTTQTFVLTIKMLLKTLEGGQLATSTSAGQKSLGPKRKKAI